MIDLEAIEKSCEGWRAGRYPINLCVDTFANIIVPALIKEVERLRHNYQHTREQVLALKKYIEALENERRE